MKKEKILRICLILLPVLAVGLATTTDSVMVFDAVAGTTEHYSYFDLIPVSNLQMCAPLAGILCAVCAIFSIVYVTLKKDWCIKLIAILSFGAAMLAVIPVLVRGDVTVVPNVGVPVFMLVQCALAYYLKKMPREEEKYPKGKRLK